MGGRACPVLFRFVRLTSEATYARSDSRIPSRCRKTKRVWRVRLSFLLSTLGPIGRRRPVLNGKHEQRAAPLAIDHRLKDSIRNVLACMPILDIQELGCIDSFAACAIDP